MEGEEGVNWSERVKDLVKDGEVEKAISILDSQVSKLETLTNSSSSQLDSLRLSTAVSDLSRLHSSNGFSLKADESRSRARDLKFAVDSGQVCSAPCKSSPSEGKSCEEEHLKQPSTVLAKTLHCSKHSDDDLEKSSGAAKTALQGEEFPDDDWEALADRAPEQLLPSQCFPEVFSRPSVKEKDSKVQAPKWRGRGTFFYTAHGLRNNQQPSGPASKNSESEVAGQGSVCDTSRKVSYGTRHVLVLADLPPCTTTIDLEKLFENFKEHGVVLRWVSDTVALAVFKSPTFALEVCNQIQCPFTVRVLDENDVLLSSISPRDLEPPRERPKTSTRAATRMIAQGMGIKLPTASFGSKELKKQEQARRDRIVLRQNMRDDAWGDGTT